MSTWPDNLICEFTVPGLPIAQPRVKATRRGNHTGVYTPTKNASGASNGIAEYKAAIRLKAAEEYDGEPLDRPFRVVCEFVFPRPAGRVWKTRPMPSYPHTSKPDADNCIKAVLDALAFLWVDDSRVCKVAAVKRVAAGGEQPHTRVMVFDESAAAKAAGGVE